MLFHIIDSAQWSKAKLENEYRPERFKDEGFIHLSQKDQILTPANLLYRGQNNLQLLVIDPALLSAEVICEPGSHGEAELFPHLYGPLNTDAVVSLLDFPCELDGSFALPDGLAN